MQQGLEHSCRKFLSRRSNIGGKVFKGCLSLLSAGYGAGVALRNIAYDSGILPTHSSGARCVISIGNIQVGGAGKTPFTLMLAQILTRYLKTAILSRGYRSKASTGTTPVLINDDGGPCFTAVFCGDEPYLLAQRLPNVHIIISKNRVAASRSAVGLGVDVVLLDDGFQHRCLKRDFNIVLIDASLSDEALHLLPRGLLREKPKALSRADLIVVTQAKDIAQVEAVRSQIARWSDAPVISADRIVAELCGREGIVRTDLASHKAALFCGIANPSSFVQTVEQLGLPIITKHFFADHTVYAPESLRQWALNARDQGATCLICTEKDTVKIHHWANILPLPLFWPKMDMRISTGHTIWENWLQKVMEKARR